MADLQSTSASEMLALHARIMEELQRRGILRSANNPTGDLAEHLFCEAFGWTQAGNSNANLDALGPDGVRYQIKGRRITSNRGSRQLSAIRDLDGEHFDVLAGLLFAADYRVLRAALVPRSVVVERATFVARTNSHRFLLRDDIWDAPGVRDVTNTVASVVL